MASRDYRIEIKPSAKAELDALDPKTRAQLRKRIGTLPDYLRERPFKQPVQKLRKQPMIRGKPRDAYRLRSGDYRVVFVIDEKERSVTIYTIGDRKRIYRDLQI